MEEFSEVSPEEVATENYRFSLVGLLPVAESSDRAIDNADGAFLLPRPDGVDPKWAEKIEIAISARAYAAQARRDRDENPRAVTASTSLAFRHTK